MKSIIFFLFFFTSANSQTIIDSTNTNCNDWKGKNFTRGILSDLRIKYLSKIQPYKIIDNPIKSRMELEFLNNDFKSDIFNKFCSLRGANFRVISSEKSLHIGIIEIQFNSELNLKKARMVVEKSKRTNFKLKVLTKFILFEKENSLLFIFTETPNEEILIKFFNNLYAKS